MLFVEPFTLASWWFPGVIIQAKTGKTLKSKIQISPLQRGAV
jgi:hypothetical protein